MDSPIRLGEDVTPGVVNLYRGKNQILEVHQPSVDGRFRGVQIPDGIVTSGANVAISDDKKAKCVAFGDSRKELSNRLKQLGADDALVKETFSRLDRCTPGV